MSLNNWWHNWGSVVGKPGTRYSGPLLIYTAGVEEARCGLLGRLDIGSRGQTVCDTHEGVAFLAARADTRPHHLVGLPNPQRQTVGLHDASL
jgi:hypothetical protein